MRAMVLREPAEIMTRPLRLMDLPRPQPSAGEVLVKVRACGVCRTDVHVIEGDLPFLGRSIIPGHQVVGVIEEQGPGVTRFALGTRVGVAWLGSTCGVCTQCLHGQENLCEKSLYTGYHQHGGFAEYVTAKEQFVYPIPDSFSDQEATPLLCAGIIGFRTLERSNLPHGGTLALFGFGSSAHITIQVARHRGSRVFVATRGEKHRALAKKLGAVWTGDTFDPLPEMVDSAIVFAPLGDIVPVALRSIRKGGTVALAGIHMTPIPTMTYAEHLFHEKDLRSVEANTRGDGVRFLEEASAIPIRPRTIAAPLEEANEVLIKLKHDELEGTAVLVP